MSHLPIWYMGQVPTALCDAAVAEFSAIPAKDATMGIDADVQDTRTRSTVVRFAEPNHWFGGLMLQHGHYANQAMKWDFEITGHEAVQFAEYGPEQKYSWHTDTDLGINTFYSNHFLPGDVLYVNNPDFDRRTPHFRGVNAVLLNDGTLFGHGFNIRTSEEMIQILNEKRKPGSHQSAYLTRLVTRPSFKYLYRVASWNRNGRAYKMQRPIVHHNKSSISYAHYLYYSM